jgi:outer membrane lipoprotein SlyB
MKTLTFNSFALSAALLLGACATTGDNYRADVYKAGQVNQQQEVKTIQLIAVMPARVEVDNKEAVKRAQIAGGILGALAGGVAGAHIDGQSGVGVAAGGAVGVAAGSMVADKKLVDGVSLTYSSDGKTYNSAQVGQICEYAPGLAILVSQTETETRIQPNSTCPEKKG